MPRLALYLLGPPRVERGGQPVKIAGRKAMALLAYLAVTSLGQEGRRHSRESLAALLWPESDPSRARAELRRALSSLRRALGDGVLEADRESAGLRQAQPNGPSGLLWLDVDAFSRCRKACESHEHSNDKVCADCVPCLEEAATLYSDDFMAGFTLKDSLAFDEWQFFQTQELRDGIATALEKLTRFYAEKGAYESGIPYARRRVEHDPLNEAAHRGLMELYARAGQKTAVLRQYELCRKTLERELGMPPSPETSALYGHVRSGQVGPVQPQMLPSDALIEELPSHNLPAQPNPFIGRETELKELLALLRDPAVRMVSVVGVGGMGKTRLALQAAAGVLSVFPEGVWLAELARIATPEAVTLTVARSLGVQPQPDRDLADTIVDALGTRELLLVLDNCEHVLEGVVPLVGQLLSRCPQLKLMATTREALRVHGERIYDLPSMKVPSIENPPEQLSTADAVRLFVERGKDVRAGFALTENNAVDVADICRRLDGLPLAIELAAARLRILSPAEIASRFDDRFRLLTRGARTLLPRQQTLYNTVTWSYELLNETERSLFDRVSVFLGGFTLQAAEAVASGEGVEPDEVLDLLADLADKSLVTATHNDGVATRYSLLETLRQYGAERLEECGATEAVCLRHAMYYLVLVEGMEPELDLCEDWANLFKRLDSEADNLAAAMRWSLEHSRAELVLRVGGALRWWLIARPHFGQYASWLERALQDCGEIAPRYRAKALFTIDLFNYFSFGYDEASAGLAEQSFAAAKEAGDPNLIAQALLSLGGVASSLGHHERAIEYYQQSLDIGREVPNYPCIVEASAHIAMSKPPEKALVMLRAMLPQTPKGAKIWILQHLVGCSLSAGDLAGAGQYAWEAYEAAGELKSDAYRMAHLGVLGTIAKLQGDYDKAEQFLTRSSQLARRTGAVANLFSAICWLGEVEWLRGNLAAAEERWNEAMDLARQHGLAANVAEVHRWLSYAACSAGEYELAEELCRLSLEGLDEGDAFGRRWGNVLLARIALFRGEPARAAELFQEFLRDMGPLDWLETIYALEGLVWAFVALERHEEAAPILGCLAAARERTGMVLPPVDQPHHDDALRSAREALGAQPFSRAWNEGAELTLEEAVAEVTA